MSLNINEVRLAGNLTRDPEPREVVVGGLRKVVVSFGLAINERWGERQRTTYVECEAWERTAEIIRDHLVKGKPIYIAGRLKMDEWNDKTTGAKRSKLKVVVERMQFVGPRNQDNPQQNVYGGEGSTGQPPQDDIPF